MGAKITKYNKKLKYKQKRVVGPNHGLKKKEWFFIFFVKANFNAKIKLWGNEIRNIAMKQRVATIGQWTKKRGRFVTKH